MMRLAEIEAQLSGMRELLNIVSAMRSLAGMRMQEAERALAGVRLYAEAMASGIADAEALMGGPPPAAPEGARTALVCFMAEHGFVGGFDERLADAVEAAADPHGALFVLGTRGAARLVERGNAVRFSHPMATRASAAPGVVQRLADALYAALAKGAVDRVEALFARSTGGSSSRIERVVLLPLDTATLAPAAPRDPALHTLPPDELHRRLTAEYVFAMLIEAAIESVTSENGARLAAMEAARENVSKRLDGLEDRARQARQSEITAELLDLVTGAEALERD